MTVSIRDAKASLRDRQWIEASYRDYLFDLSAGGTGVFPALTVTGQSEGELLAGWFRNDRSTPLLVLRAGVPVGFALVERVLGAAATSPQYHLAEFFIRRQDRGLGVGREAAGLIFTRFPGDWRVTESSRQSGAVNFWRKVIGAYTGGRYRERLADGEVRHFFSSAAPGQAHP
jgi:predicted acetyltransferase